MGEKGADGAGRGRWERKLRVWGARGSHTRPLPISPHKNPPSQVKGLQAEYERVTAKPAEVGSSKGGGADAAGEVDEWKGKVDKLIREKNEQQVGQLGE